MPMLSGSLPKTGQDRCYADAVRILTENRALLDEIALYLLNKETITGDELMSFINASNQEPAVEEPVAEETVAEETVTEEANESTDL